MTANMSCPGCQTSLRIRDDMAGKKIKCPRCGQVLTIPTTAEDATEVINNPEQIVTAPAPKAPAKGAPERAGSKKGKTRPCPSCGEPIATTARQCRHCHADLEDEDDGVQAPSRYKPCPRCGETGAKRVLWTFWGSFYGPSLFTHVRCPGCGYTYNGRTGRSNIIPAIVFFTVPLLLILGLLGFIFWIFHKQGWF
jgi:predicted Zn finger-like uncharacterized protein